MATEPLPTCYRHPDRETGLECSQCGRPICAECMTPTPVGQRCPECVGRQRVERPRSMASVTPIVTYALIAINALVYIVIEHGLSGSPSPASIERLALYGPYVADGEPWRLVTSTFLHASLLHIGFNMYALYAFGPALEQRFGAARYLALYLVAGVFGSAGALLVDANAVTVGASGSIFGLMAALAVVLKVNGARSMGGLGIVIVMNLVFTFTVPGISIGGHVGGIVGGALMAALIEGVGVYRRRQAWLVWVGTAALLGIGTAVAMVAAGS
jgi:membrane associated rhomboid family serine protease